MSRISPLRLTVLASVFLLLAAFLLVGWDMVLLGICRSRLGSYDPHASVESARAAPGVLILDGMELPSMGLMLDRTLVFWHGGPFSPTVDSAFVCGGRFHPEMGEEMGPEGGDGQVDTPPIAFSGLGIFHPLLGELQATGRLSGTAPGDSIDLMLRSCWSEGFGTVFLREGADSLDLEWFRCSTGWEGLSDLPDLIRGHEVKGRGSGTFGGDLSLQGELLELDGEPALMGFDVRTGSDGPRVSISVLLSPMREFLGEAVSSILDADSVSIVPSGSIEILFAGGDTLDAEIHARLDSIVIDSHMLSEDLVEFSASMEFEGTAVQGERSVRIDSGTVSVGTVSIRFSLNALLDEEPSISLRLWSDSLSGADLSSSVPPGLMGRLQGLQLGGWASFDIALDLDWAEPDSCDFSSIVDVAGLTVPYSPVGIGGFRTGGSCLMKDSWGNSRRISLEPGDSTLLPFDSLPPVLESLLRCAEDATFRSHSGFCEYHVRNSIRANIASGAFVRGGSTITMQLARNLLLDRDKNIARKVQEVFLTWRLESYLSKDRILEIYARIVELGPDVFGFQEAAMYYFGVDMDLLSLRQTAYLVSILPGPRLYHRFFLQGHPPGYWEDYLDRLLVVSGNRGWIPQDMVAEALEDSIRFPDHTTLSD